MPVTTTDSLILVRHLLRLSKQARKMPPYHDDPELLALKKKLEEDISFEQMNIQEA